jgi:hypothetical protein
VFDFPPEEPQREIINAHARNSGEGARTFAPSGDGDRPDQNGQQDGAKVRAPSPLLRAWAFIISRCGSSGGKSNTQFNLQ